MELLNVRLKDVAWLGAGILTTLVASWASRCPHPDPGHPFPVPPIVEPIPSPPPAPSIPRPPSSPDSVQATARFSSGSVGCTCTILGPTPRKGYTAVLTANHCVGRVGRGFTVILKNGKRYEATTIAVDREADIALGVIKTDDVLPWARIADRDPEPGTKIWQAGYGVGKPEKRYDGTVEKIGSAQTQMCIRFFSGDSGGGIFRDDDNTLISVVCCTNGPQGWGGTVARIRAMLADAEKRYTSDGYTFDPGHLCEPPASKEKED